MYYNVPKLVPKTIYLLLHKGKLKLYVYVYGGAGQAERGREERKGQRNFRELAHMLLRAGKSKIYREGQEAGN